MFPFFGCTHLCNLCVDTRWLAHVLRDRPDGSHGAGGLLQVGGPVADALWLQGFGVALLTLCLFVGKKQQEETKITIRTTKMNMHPFANLAQVSLFPAPSATHSEPALGRLGVRVTNQPTGCWARCSSAVRGLLRGQVCLAPWAAQGPVSVTMVSRVCSVTMVALVACTPFGTGGYSACYQCGVASAQCGGIGSPGAVVPLCQVTLLASFPSLHHAYHGSLVTLLVCFLTPPCVSPYPCA